MILTGENAALLDALYEKYTQNPNSIDPNWARYFREIDSGLDPTPVPVYRRETTPTHSSNGRSSGHAVGVQTLIESYRRFGHMAAKLDPLDLAEPDRELLDLSLHGLNESMLDQSFDSGISGVGTATLRTIVEHLEKTYCSSIGVEYAYLRIREERDWLQETMEATGNQAAIDTWEKRRLYEKVYQAENFEKFLAQKFVGKKRFSLEGGDTFIPIVDGIVEEAGARGIKGIGIAMAHRGRLNLLVNVLEKPAGVIFAEFEENYNPETLDYADVKYHLGYSYDRTTRSGNEVHLSLAFNPSHLEAVDPVVMGSTRARQAIHGDAAREQFMPIIVHGDAAFMGQGVVAETLNLSGLEGYAIGGAMHIVINNQIGFTTLPPESRSTLYATDLAKGFQIPIFHVNGDDPLAAHRAMKLAMEYRQRFHKDVIIDLICYRRLGHNETDEPAFTQPLMYDAIKKHPTTAKVFRQHLLDHEDDVTEEDIEYIEDGVTAGLQKSFEKARETNVQMVVDTMRGRWADFSSEPLDSEPQTKLLREQLDRVVKALTSVPDDFNVHKKLQRLLDNRRKMFSGEEKIDWGFAEALAFGSILANGHNIRLSGQDAQRGTFSHRHAVLTDVKNGSRYIATNHISEGQGKLEVINSPLSEFSVLGFEYGYSLTDPQTLVIWEAQFGDFVNSAQIMIDQFISSSEMKWHRMSGLVMLLPHGYEGQGPEHSSARLERFLQLCSRNNMQVCNCTTPAQYFHLLRRQILRRYRKPLIIMSPKSLLRLAEAGSDLEDLALGVFREVLHDREHESPDKVKRLLVCSGKVYYDLNKRRREKGMDHVGILRMEQLYPYPLMQIADAMTGYKNLEEVMWVQEEPRNQGAWYFIKDRLHAQLPGGVTYSCVGRDESPSPAAGLAKVHQRELEHILSEAVG